MDKGSEILERLIHAANVRQRVLASNIANSDTPDYRAKDVDFRSIITEETIRLLATDPRHIQSMNPGGPDAEVKTELRDPWADGNNVELDMEMAKMTENALLHETGIRLLSTKIQMFRNALRR